MATRSRIGYVLKDDSIVSVYHHWDGYPEWLGNILKKHYNEDEKVRELIDGGDMSSCYTDSTWDLEERNPNHHPVIIQSVARIAHLDTFKHCPI